MTICLTAAGLLDLVRTRSHPSVQCEKVTPLFSRSDMRSCWAMVPGQWFLHACSETVVQNMKLRLRLKRSLINTHLAVCSSDATEESLQAWEAQLVCHLTAVS